MALDVNAQLQTEDGLTQRPLNVNDLTTLPTDAATETTLAAILSALGSLLTTSNPEASNAAGTDNVIPGSTEVLAAVNAPAGYRLRGFAASGDGDGYFELVVNGSKKLVARTRFQQPSVVVLFPNPVAVTAGHTIQLKVTNEADGNVDYDGFVFGEVV